MVTYTSNRQLRSLVVSEMMNNRVFEAGAEFESVADTNTKTLLIENPSDSGVVVLILDPEIRSNGQVRTGRTKNVTVDTAGSSQPLIAKSTSSVTAEANAQIGGANETGTYSGGTAYPEQVIGSGAGGPNAPGASSLAGVTNIIRQGDNLAVDVTADGGSRSFSIVVGCIEYPAENVP